MLEIGLYNFGVVIGPPTARATLATYRVASPEQERGSGDGHHRPAGHTPCCCRAGRPRWGPARQPRPLGQPESSSASSRQYAGDDIAILTLLHQLADVADTDALLLLHRRLIPLYLHR